MKKFDGINWILRKYDWNKQKVNKFIEAIAIPREYIVEN